jgi:RNA polymerase sigma-70 factor (ECF subfamily)
MLRGRGTRLRLPRVPKCGYSLSVSAPPHPDPRSDLDLVRAINAGDLAAFDALYYRYRAWVVRLARRFTGHDDDALDVLQDAFGYVFRKFPGFHLTASMTTFLYPVVRNLSIAARRKRLRQAQLSDDSAAAAEPVAPAGVDHEAGRAELTAVLAGLPEGQRDVLLMRFVDGMSLAEIGEALGIPEGTVKSRLHNALATLRADARAARYFEP